MTSSKLSHSKKKTPCEPRSERKKEPAIKIPPPPDSSVLVSTLSNQIIIIARSRNKKRAIVRWLRKVESKNEMPPKICEEAYYCAYWPLLRSVRFYLPSPGFSKMHALTQVLSEWMPAFYRIASSQKYGGISLFNGINLPFS